MLKLYNFSLKAFGFQVFTTDKEIRPTSAECGIDDDFPNVGKTVSLFGLEGVFENPLEWVDWEIESASFYLIEYLAYDSNLPNCG